MAQIPQALAQIAPFPRAVPSPHYRPGLCSGCATRSATAGLSQGVRGVSEPDGPVPWASQHQGPSRERSSTEKCIAVFREGTNVTNGCAGLLHTSQNFTPSSRASAGPCGTLEEGPPFGWTFTKQCPFWALSSAPWQCLCPHACKMQFPAETSFPFLGYIFLKHRVDLDSIFK